MSKFISHLLQDAYLIYFKLTYKNIYYYTKYFYKSLSNFVININFILFIIIQTKKLLSSKALKLHLILLFHISVNSILYFNIFISPFKIHIFISNFIIYKNKTFPYSLLFYTILNLILKLSQRIIKLMINFLYILLQLPDVCKHQHIQ